MSTSPDSDYNSSGGEEGEVTPTPEEEDDDDEDVRSSRQPPPPPPPLRYREAAVEVSHEGVGASRCACNNSICASMFSKNVVYLQEPQLPPQPPPRPSEEQGPGPE